MGLDIMFIKEKVLTNFRKVNFLVKFFEDRYGPINNLTPISIDPADIEGLINRCYLVLADHSKAKELLPTMDGFFFGNTEYNDAYFEDVFNVYVYCKEFLMKEFESGENITFKIWY